MPLPRHISPSLIPLSWEFSCPLPLLGGSPVLLSLEGLCCEGLLSCNHVQTPLSEAGSPVLSHGALFFDQLQNSYHSWHYTSFLDTLLFSLKFLAPFSHIRHPTHPFKLRYLVLNSFKFSRVALKDSFVPIGTLCSFALQAALTAFILSSSSCFLS